MNNLVSLRSFINDVMDDFSKYMKMKAQKQFMENQELYEKNPEISEI